ncbi:MAG TPA: hypothetical protein VE173_04600, partial [Longimicrobiales bacterium]|nr:hypothetical protein [Longimicrobiales bacterium]
MRGAPPAGPGPDGDGTSSRGEPARPPALARWLLARVLPPADRDTVLSELDEFHRRRATRGRAVRAWYWWQTLAYVVRRPQLGGRRPGRGGGVARDVRWAARSL